MVTMIDETNGSEAEERRDTVMPPSSALQHDGPACMTLPRHARLFPRSCKDVETLPHAMKGGNGMGKNDPCLMNPMRNFSLFMKEENTIAKKALGVMVLSSIGFILSLLWGIVFTFVLIGQAQANPCALEYGGPDVCSFDAPLPVEHDIYYGSDQTYDPYQDFNTNTPSPQVHATPPVSGWMAPAAQPSYHQGYAAPQRPERPQGSQCIFYEHLRVMQCW